LWEVARLVVEMRGYKAITYKEVRGPMPAPSNLMSKIIAARLAPIQSCAGQARATERKFDEE